MPPSVIVVGGGFAGAEAARRLGGRAAVTLVSDDNFLLFTPMLAEVAAGDVEPRHITAPLREIAPKARVVVGTAIDVDVGSHAVTVRPSLGGPAFTEQADALILAPGSVPADFGISGVAEWTLPFKSIADALRVRRRMLALLETATEVRHPNLTRVVIVGAGYSGAELAAGLSDFLAEAWRRFYRSAHPPRVTIVDAVDRVAPMLPKNLSESAAAALRSRGVEVVLGRTVTGVRPGSLLFEDGGTMDAATIIWTAGVAPHPLAEATGLERGRGGRLVADGSLRVAGGVYAAGDIALAPDGHGDVSPPTAQHGLRQGAYLGKHLPDLLQGVPVEPFRYKTMGQLVSLGHRNAVGVVLGRELRGFAGWFAWRSYYLSRVPTLLRKARVAFDWTLDLVFPPDVAQIPSGEIGRIPPGLGLDDEPDGG